MGTELIFTIHEAKGLEFESLLLWKFASDFPNQELWHLIAEEQALPTEQQLRARYEINLLYMAVTRSRNLFCIYDGPAVSAIWQNKLLGDPRLLGYSSLELNRLDDTIRYLGQAASKMKLAD